MHARMNPNSKTTGTSSTHCKRRLNSLGLRIGQSTRAGIREMGNLSSLSRQVSTAPILTHQRTHGNALVLSGQCHDKDSTQTHVRIRRTQYSHALCRKTYLHLGHLHLP